MRRVPSQEFGPRQKGRQLNEEKKAEEIQVKTEQDEEPNKEPLA